MSMLVLITYDVSVISEGGQRRLRRIAKACQDYGMRVQNSVFECDVDSAQFVILRDRLVDIFDPENDSLRFYFLGKKGRRKVEHMGAKVVPDVFNDTLVL
jgi:CRISPR-associated protein Cas2